MLRRFSVQCWKTGRDAMTLRDDVALSTRLFLKKCVGSSDLLIDEYTSCGRKRETVYVER